MKRVISTVATIMVLSVVSLFNTSRAQAVVVSEIEKNLDFNKDGRVNGHDWLKMNVAQKEELITAYYTSAYKSLLINMSATSKDREVFRVISRLNYYYSGVNSQNKIVDVWDTYQLLVE